MVSANKKPRIKVKDGASDRVFDALVMIFSILALIIVLVPLLHIVSCSLSSGAAVQGGHVFILPVDPTLTAYNMVFQYKDIWIGYLNTIYYTAIGTFINVACTILCAYPLSRKDLKGNGIIMKLMIFTMMFSGGLIPGYILVKDLKLLNTAWSLWLPGMFSVYNMIVMRTFFRSTIPPELLEAAQMDGCTNRRFLWSIVIPLSGTIIAVMVLLYAIGHWNNYFSAMLFITDKKKYPLQLFLREILIASEVDFASVSGSSIKELLKKQELKLLMKYAIIVVSSLPVLMMYPFVQKYLVKGVMIGSVKG